MEKLEDQLGICIKKLVEHGWLVRGTGRQIVNGVNSMTFWRVVLPGTRRIAVGDNRWTGEFINKRTMMTRGPSHLRDGNL
ncbi:hypothetical protein [Octadecabacter antarcticus]|uniref:hypothetical protein n=1 Tax=Octadecabacter antarcticus TaxID=1217908 RepID=UPI0005C744E9|nr:hypothetical protein [Octadecabacter antarcticus]